jgi:hypothetical protein
VATVAASPSAGPASNTAATIREHFRVPTGEYLYGEFIVASPL